jgi:hypothetical protein
MSSYVNRVVQILLKHKELFFLFILTCVLFFPVFIHFDQIIYPPGNVVGNDVTAQYSFWRSFFAASIRNGTGIPFWNPYVFSGTPFVGDPLSAIFYPFTWIFVFFNSDLLFGWLFLIDVFLIGIFTFTFARTIKLSKSASFFSAVAFMFSGTIILRVYAGHLSNLDAIVWFPLVLTFYERSFSHNRYMSGIGAGISLALMLLSGNIQFALYGASAALVYLTGRVMVENTIPSLMEKCRHLAMMLLISVGVCCLISAVQILPTWEYSQLSNRAGGVSYDFSSANSLPPSYLITALVPDAYGNPLVSEVNFSAIYWELCFYMGILPLLLAVLAILFNRSWRTYLFSAIAVLAFLFSFGVYFPLYRFSYYYLPGFSLLRIPASMLFVGTFSLALLAGLGWETVFQENPPKENRFVAICSKPWIRGITLFIALLAGLGIIVLLHSSGSVKPDYLIPVMFGYAACIVLFCIWPFMQRRKKPVCKQQADLLKILLIILFVIDLFSFGMRFIDTKPPAEVFKNPAFISVIKNETDPYFRIYDETGLLDQNIAYRNNLYLINGYDPTWLKAYRTFFIQSQPGIYDAGPESWNEGAVIKNFDILRLLNVRYIVTSRHYDSDLGVPGLQCVYNNNSILVYRLNVTYPRAYLIPVSEFGNGTPLLVQPVQIDRYSPNTIVVNVTTFDPGYLVLSEIYYPGWTARDNSTISEIIRYRGVFRAVYLEPGQHLVTFNYFPKILTI